MRKSGNSSKNQEIAHKELILSYKNATNPVKKDRIFEELHKVYFKLITDILIHNGISNVHIEDSIEYSVALTAMFEALSLFDISKGNEFSTFLTHHIRIHLIRHFAGYVCGVDRFAEKYDTTEAFDRSVLESDDDDQESLFYDCEELVDTMGPEPLSIESPELLSVPEHLSERPSYERYDSEEELDQALLNKFSDTVVLGLKILAGLAGYGKLGKIHVFKLIGTEHREELTTVLSRYSIN